MHRLIEIGKLQITAREEENKNPLKNFARKSKNRIGIDENKFISCRACGEEFCSAEVCSQFAYDFFERTTTIESTSQEETAATMAALDDNENYRKKRKKGKKFPFFPTRKRKLQIRPSVKSKKNTVRVDTNTKNDGDRTMSKQNDSERKIDKNLQSQIKQSASRIVKRKSKTHSRSRVGKKEKIN